MGEIKNIASYVDATILKATATKDDIVNLCEQAQQYNFAAICVAGQWVSLCREQLENSITKVCATIGFPLGHQTTQTKVTEARELVRCGASEIDMVISLGSYFSKNYTAVEKDIAEVHKAVIDEGKQNSRETLLKVILETCYLSHDDIINLCKICVHAGAEFVKTSTGFGTHGATVEHVALMAQTVGNEAKVKAAGGIRDYETAKKMIEAGASRIGTSGGADIVNGTSSSANSNY